MVETRLVIRMNKREKTVLQQKASKYGYSLSDYVKKKMFAENEDDADEDIYISPNKSKRDIVTISALYKTFYMVKELFEKQGISIEEIQESERRALEYARKERERYGYKILKVSNE